MIRFETLEEKEQQNNSMWWQKQFYKSITHEPLHRIVHIYFMFFKYYTIKSRIITPTILPIIDSRITWLDLLLFRLFDNRPNNHSIINNVLNF